MHIEETGSNVVSADKINDNVELAIIKYSLNPSIKNFHPPTENIPAKVLLENSDLHLPHLVNTYNLCIYENYFPNEVKDWDISSLLKKDDAYSKENFRPITVL